jgi:putative membrane protein
MWSAAAALFAAALALAAPPDNPPKADNPPMNVSDADFVMKSTEAQLAEINFGNLAAQQASDPQVKAFGQRMVDDHTKALQDEDRVADKTGMKVAQTMNAQDRDTFQKLSGLRGADFDKQYVAGQVAAHKDAVAQFEAEAKNGKNDDVKAYAEKTLPILKDHLQMAQKLAGSDTGTTPAKTGTDKDQPDKTTPPAKKDK